MTETDLAEMKRWFARYAGTFSFPDREDQKNILIKVSHTEHVCQDIQTIVRGLSSEENTARLAEAIALFHDIGRFRQYREYRTFRDALSVNHGKLGEEVLTEEKILQGLPPGEQDLIAHSVRYHNAYGLPRADRQKLFFLKLIRDADKLDIFRVFIAYYEGPPEERASATAFGIPDTPEYSDVMLAAMMNRKVASYSNIRTENDFRLMKLSWVFDIHYQGTLRLLHERGLIDRIARGLPRDEKIISAVALLREYVAERLEGRTENS